MKYGQEVLCRFPANFSRQLHILKIKNNKTYCLGGEESLKIVLNYADAEKEWTPL